MPSDPSAPDPDQPDPQAPTKDAPADDPMHQQFRAALQRKKAGHQHPGDAPPGGRGAGPHSNDKRQRQFRRKSGG